MSADRPAVVIDLDGTLIDTNYHHAIAWFHAFRDVDVDVPIWRIHRHIGMGGDQFVPAVAGQEVEERHGSELRDGWEHHFAAIMDETRPLPGARELLAALKDRGHPVVLATSSPSEQLDRHLDVLGARPLLDAWTGADDVEATKPEPDIVRVALERLGREDGVMIGDSVWDCESARRAGIPSIGLLTGGFSAAELEHAGAAHVHASLDALRGDLDRAPLGAPAVAAT